MPILLLIRHAENDVLKTRIAGRMPGVHLNAKGLQQALALAQSLADAPLTAIYSSPMERALETAAPLAAEHHLEVQIHPDLIEVDYGRVQGRTYKQLWRTNLWKLVHERPSAVQFPEGECMPAVMQRATRALDELAERHTGDQVVACVTHGDLIRLAIVHYLGLPLDAYHSFAISTASITVLSLEKDCPRLLNINQVSTLEWPQHS